MVHPILELSEQGKSDKISLNALEPHEYDWSSLWVPLVEGLSERGEEASRSQGPQVEYGHLTFK